MSNTQNSLGIFRPVFILILIIWGVHILNFTLSYRMNGWFGLYPRQSIGLPGIALSPFLHGNFNHIIANSAPLIILSSIAMAVDRTRWLKATIIIILLAGLLLWMFGRSHTVVVGASGLVFGYFGYLVALAFADRSAKAAIGAVAAIALYGGMIWGILPDRPQVSWEGHLFGVIAGIVSAFILRRRKRMS